MIVLKRIPSELSLWDSTRASYDFRLISVSGSGWVERPNRQCMQFCGWYESILLTPKVPVLSKPPLHTPYSVPVQSSCQRGQVFRLAMGPLAPINCPLIH